MNMLNATELLTLKWSVLCYMNLTSMKKINRSLNQSINKDLRTAMAPGRDQAGSPVFEWRQK